MTDEDEVMELRKKLRAVQAAMNQARTDRDYRHMYVQLCALLGTPEPQTNGVHREVT